MTSFLFIILLAERTTWALREDTVSIKHIRISQSP